MMYLDCDELPELFRRRWLWSADRFNVSSFRRQDYHGPAETDLKSAVLDTVEAKLGIRPQGSVTILTHMRYFGLCFNPVSFYFCHGPDGSLEAILAEIENTPWGERFCYAFKAPEGQHHFTFKFRKNFHVSPFLPMDMDYEWTFSKPRDNLCISMRNLQDQELVFNAGLQLIRKPITSANLASILCRYPFMTFKVVAGIYLQALKLWLRKIPFFEHPKYRTQKYHSSLKEGQSS